MNNFFSQNTIDAWIQVVGTLLATIIGGIISAKVAVLTLKREISEENKKLNKNIKAGKQMISEFINLAISSLLMIMDVEDIEVEEIIDINTELKKIKAVNVELSNIPRELISYDINEDFQSSRVLLKILEVEIEAVIDKANGSKENFVKEIKKINLDYRLLQIVKYSLRFDNLPELKSLYNDLSNIIRDKKVKK